MEPAIKESLTAQNGAAAGSAHLSDEQIELSENLGSFLWESSTLRHGLFTPTEFSRLASERIKQYFYEQNDQGEARR